VPIDISNETLISLPEAGRSLPAGRRGRPVHASCIFRWIMQGSTAPDGRRVRLEAIRLGGRWLTSREALSRFAEALTPQFDDEPIMPRSQTQRQRASAQARRELEAAGVYPRTGRE
jgi:hypothetical protein